RPVLGTCADVIAAPPTPFIERYVGQYVRESAVASSARGGEQGLLPVQQSLVKPVRSSRPPHPSGEREAHSGLQPPQATRDERVLVMAPAVVVELLQGAQQPVDELHGSAPPPRLLRCGARLEELRA